MSNALPISADIKPQRQSELLQPAVLATIDLTLTLKQLHWNLQGPAFQSVHEFLDVIVEHTRVISDDLAERVVTLGVAAVGRSGAVGANAHPAVPDSFVTDRDAVAHGTEHLAKTIDVLRGAQAELGEIDPISEDLVIGAVATLEKDLWMLRSLLK